MLQIVYIISSLSFAFCQYQIVFYIDHAPPPIIPLDVEQYLYSVPLNQVISKPVIMSIQFDNGSLISRGALASETYEFSTVDEKFAQSPTRYTDAWAKSGGKLCQKSSWWLDYPARLDRTSQKVRCGSKVSDTTLLIKAINGIIIADWIYHKHDVAPLNKRVFRCRLLSNRIKADSYPFLITAPAHHLTITQQPPKSVLANHDFTIIAEIRYQNDSVVTSGLDSAGIVDITIPYYHKIFINEEIKKMQLKSTPYRLGGKDTILNQGNYDWIIRKRAVKGIVRFDNIRVLDPVKVLQLNLTLTMIRDPWLRIPNCDSCYADIERMKISADGKEVTYPRPDPFLMNKLQGVVLTDPFEVKQQKLHKLAFSEYTNEFFKKYTDKKTKFFHLVRNMAIPGYLALIANDNTSDRIYAGSESEFKITYKTIPASVCISSDATNSISGGYREIKISICQIIDNVTIEIIPSIRPTASVFTPAFRVRGAVNVAHFGDFRYSGAGAQVQSHVNSFIRFAASDINKGHMLPYLSKQGFEFKIRSYETQSTTEKAFEAILDMEHKNLPEQKVMLIISSTTEAITYSITPELYQLGAAFFSTSNTAAAFRKKDRYPFFNRLCWSDIESFKSVLLACKGRMWTNLIVIREEHIHFTEEYHSKAESFGVEFIEHVIINPSGFIRGQVSYLNEEMARIKNAGTKIILLMATKKVQPFILRAAQLAGVDSFHGYQWILYSKYSWQFPFANEGLCRLKPACTNAFKSTMLFSETYNITGYHTKDWIRVLGYYFSADRFLYKGGRVRFRPPEVGAKMALGYDSVILYGQVIQRIISKRETVDVKKISQYARNLPVNGLSGKFMLDAYGDRVGYYGFMAQINPLFPDKIDAPIQYMVSFTRTLIRQKDGSELEIPYFSFRPTGTQSLESKAALPVVSKYNIRVYKSISGLVNQLTQKLIKNPTEPWPSVKYTRQEKLAPMFYCDFTCGKKLLSVSDVNVYDTGRCDAGKRCICNPGFHGNFCELITCKCQYGICLGVNHCFCHHGWKGQQCNLAICDRCEHGTCVEPQKCKCTSRKYIGVTCETHLSIVVVPVFLGSALIIGLIYLLIKYILKHAERNAALANTDWIVEWPYVTQYLKDDAGGNSKTSVGDKSNVGLNTYIWKTESWYGKAISSKTIDPRIPELRLEMVDLVKIRNRNLINYGGACLTSPNVCLFLEIADKGSLNDILLNNSIDLGWEFKWSFMKDICAGMKFLHEKTNLVSHGRLKSHNCLIDSRWTVRISGFGAHIIRFGKFRLPNETKEDLKELFWTAPELLENVTSLDDLKNGTQAGDTYSFSIILTEILTRGEPYDYELEHISEKAIFDLITDNPSRDAKNAQKTWEELGGSSMFQCRPILRDQFLPESGLQKKQFVKMLDDAWNENPSGRMSFDKLMNMLNQIHPTKGELIDNLINLLESYSTNLEVIVVERTKELEVSKARAEQLLSQMLPRKVCAELKLGKKIPPEVFSTATVFFSDIVDFSKICQESTPFQIVDFLNETYNAFDEVLNSYDVYKVETISDSYMVVSGVPETNGIQHASFIATMALDLMSTVTTFIIPHKPKATLQLRVGINSGPVVAGVVGMLMPRYCLFGDTVNTASRMESSSQALRIQISDTTAKLLDEIGGFELESRGQREVKGRGLMTTYWLWGRDDFDKPMPDQSLALSLSQHKFK